MSDGCSLGEVVPARLSTAGLTAQSTERELLATISAGSRCAMAELYFLHFARLAKFFLHVTGRVDLVEELINDTMFDVWRESAKIGSDTSVPAWIMGLAYSRGQTRLGAAGLTGPPFEERAVLHLVYAGGFSRQSIADIMDTSGERVDVLLTDARHRLRHS
jgi:DNA-directed RNA polymerase specialized sigma24 family protein